MSAAPVKLGAPVARVEGRLKVTGGARFAAEHPTEGLVHGVVVSATIARGRITGFDLARAKAVPGVIDILTHEHRPRTRSMGIFYKDTSSPSGTPFRPLHDAKVLFAGQPVALVVAETYEAAREAATYVKVSYAAEAHETDLRAHLDRARAPSRWKLGYKPPPDERGDAEAAYAAAPVKVDAEFHAGIEHHNPMELFGSTVILGKDGHLTIYEKTQGPQNSRGVVVRVFGLRTKQVTVRNPFVGGAFGCGLRPQYQLLLAIMAALMLKRSVRVTLSRQQMYTFGHRPETAQRVRLAAERDGTLKAILHEAVAETSRFEDYAELVVNWSGQLYACENVKLGYDVVSLDRPTPMDMRAPGAAHGVNALEIAMDELAYGAGIDPLDLRLRNYAERDPEDGKPYSSKELRACYRQAAERFGWARRSPEPRSMREGRLLVGWGMATGVYDALQFPGRAKAVFGADGKLVVRSAASDIGTGTYTVMAMIAASAMGLPLERVTFELGDSTFPFAPVEGGSAHVTTLGSAVDGVCAKLRRSLWKLARGLPESPIAGAAFEDVEFAESTVRLARAPARAIRLDEVLQRARLDRVTESYFLLPDFLVKRKYARFTHSAVFCEVKVDEAFGTVRVTRVVSAIAAGRILNARTARSQIVGGIVWGIGQALHEETHTDHALGKFMNRDIAEYHIPVNADIHDIDVIFVEEDDRIVSSLGAKGVGEIGIVGVPAAVSNAIFHATGRRVRNFPMTPDKVMAPWAPLA